MPSSLPIRRLLTRTLAPGCCILAAAGPFAQSAFASDPTPSIARAGLFGPQYIGPDGVHTTDPVPSSFPSLPLPGPLDTYPISGGRILGQTIRWVIDDPRTGSTFGFTVPFLFSNGVCTPLGLTDPQHTDSSGGFDGSVTAISSTGWITGGSTRYVGGSSVYGVSAWVRSPSAQTTRIGFFDFDHTLLDGSQYSRVRAVNASGMVVGSSARRDVPASPVSFLNQSAWYYNPATSQTIPIGLLGPEFTASGGVQSSSVRSLDDSGHVLGSSERFSGDTDQGVTPWLFSAATQQTTPLGLNGPEYTRVDGFRSAAAVTMNSSGQVIGTSNSYLGSSLTAGRAAWLYDGLSTTRLGFTDAAHTDASGRQSSDVRAINNSAQVLGLSTRYRPGTSITTGTSVWIAAGSSLTRIGLFDAAHTNIAATADQVSSSRLLNNAGQAAGTSRRYLAGLPGNDGGQDPWLFDGSVTRPISIQGPNLISPSGYSFASTQSLNAQGQVIGISEQFGTQSESPIGLAGWFYDPATDHATLLNFATSSTNRVTNPQVLTDSGLVIGTISVSATDTGDLGTRLFLWSADKGLVDVNQLIPGGLAAAGWQWLSTVTKVSADGTTLIGKGRPNGAATDEGMYVLTIPTPATDTLFISAAIPAMRRPRRHKR